MQNLLNIFKALSEKIRLRIIKLLEGGELCVCDIVAALDMSQPKVSFHLNTLKEVGIIKDRKQGRWTHYSLDESDLFKRFLLLSISDRISEEMVAEDRKRLADFLQHKPVKAIVVPIQDKKRCCGS